MVLSERKKQIHNPEDVAEIMQLILSKEDENDQGKEHFWVIGVNTKNVIQYIELVSLGTVSKTLVHPRETFRLAILKGVYAIFCIIIISGSEFKSLCNHYGVIRKSFLLKSEGIDCDVINRGRPFYVRINSTKGEL